MNDSLLSRLTKWAQGEKAPPFIVDLNPTDLCNLQCKSCWQRNPKFQNLDSSYQLEDEKFLQVVQQAVQLGAKKFEITGGGEPLMRKELVLSAMRKIKEHGLTGNLTTNATLFEQRDLEKMIELGWDQLTISLDGASPETHDYLRGKRGTFETIIETLEALNSYKGEENSDKPHLKFNCVLSNRNYGQVPHLIDLAHTLDVEELSFETLTVHSPQGKELKLNQRQKQELSRKAKAGSKKAKEYGIETNLSCLHKKMLDKANQMTDLMRAEPASSFDELPCYEPWYHLVIKVDGSANPCCLYDCQQANVKQKNLEQIWYGPTFQRIRERIKQSNLSDYCQICNAGQFERNKTIRKELNTRI